MFNRMYVLDTGGSKGWYSEAFSTIERGWSSHHRMSGRLTVPLETMKTKMGSVGGELRAGVC